MKLKQILSGIFLGSVLTINATWEATTDNLKFQEICARNGVLLGVSVGAGLPYHWDWRAHAWKQLGISDAGFLSLATDGDVIAGVKIANGAAYRFNKGENLWENCARPQTLFGISFDKLCFSQKKLIGLSKVGSDSESYKSYAYMRPIDLSGPSDFEWNIMGDWEKKDGAFWWDVDAEGPIICGVQRILETEGDSDLMPKDLTKIARLPHLYDMGSNDWQKIGDQPLNQIVTTGEMIYGLTPDGRVLSWSLVGKIWSQVGGESFAHIVASGPVLCGIGAADGHILRWDGKAWLVLGERRFEKVATDGKNIYGLAHDGLVYFWIGGAY